MYWWTAWTSRLSHSAFNIILSKQSLNNNSSRLTTTLAVVSLLNFTTWVKMNKARCPPRIIANTNQPTSISKGIVRKLSMEANSRIRYLIASSTSLGRHVTKLTCKLSLQGSTHAPPWWSRISRTSTLRKCFWIDWTKVDTPTTSISFTCQLTWRTIAMWATLSSTWQSPFTCWPCLKTWTRGVGNGSTRRRSVKLPMAAFKASVIWLRTSQLNKSTPRRWNLWFLTIAKILTRMKRCTRVRPPICKIIILRSIATDLNNRQNLSF